MNNPFSQPKVTYKVRFITNYESIECFESFFPEDILGICTYEVESSTIDSKGDDLWSFEAYIAEKPDLAIIKAGLDEFAKTGGLKAASDLSITQIEDKDWVAEYQKQLRPIEIGQFVVTSNTQDIAHFKDKIPIFIEASRAFGTGEHATTALCIEAMESFRNDDIKTVFDIGTGSGILSFAAEKLWQRAKILGCDIEEVSINVAQVNKAANNSSVCFYQNTENDLVIPDSWDRKFDLIVSNILATPLISLAATLKAISHPETKVILSGFLDYQSGSVAEAYALEGFVVDKTLSRDKWVTLILKLAMSSKVNQTATLMKPKLLMTPSGMVFTE